MIIVNLDQDTPEWHSFRRMHIGASEASIILGCNIWKKPLKLWREKIGLDTSNFENDAMREGKRLEPIAREYVNEYNKLNLIPMVVKHSTIDYMSASLDGIDLDNGELWEVKCGSLKLFKQVQAEQIPDYYYSQCQHQLCCTGFNHMSFAVYLEIDNLPLYTQMTVYRDEKFIDDMLAKQKTFWDCVLNFTPPEKGIRKIDSERFKYLETQYELWKDREYESKDAMDKIKLEMILLCEDETSQGDKFKCSKVVRKGVIDFMLIPEIANVNCENYRKPPIEYWKIEEIK